MIGNATVLSHSGGQEQAILQSAGQNDTWSHASDKLTKGLTGQQTSALEAVIAQIPLQAAQRRCTA
jgi:hypothetical protein